MSSTPKHWRNYKALDGVVMFDAAGDGPTLQRVQVTANLHESDSYPECRIAIHLGKLASASLTADQVAVLREILERAEADVRRGSDLGEEQDDG